MQLTNLIFEQQEDGIQLTRVGQALAKKAEVDPKLLFPGKTLQQYQETLGKVRG
jgi:hypothetical protein